MPTGIYKRNPLLRPQTFRHCEHCQKRFGPLAHLSTRFCSHACKAASQLGRDTWNKGKRCPQLDRSETRRCVTCNSEFRSTKDYSRRRQLYCSHRCYLANRRVSHFENDVFEYLATRGIECDRSVRLGRWTFDGVARGTKIVIEADGDFWHSSKTVIERDNRKNAWCAQNGFDLVRIRESEFKVDRAIACDVAVARWEKLTGKKAERAA